MLNPVIGRCPVCGDNTIVTKIHCKKCGTTIEGKFDICKFCRLTQEQKEFIDVFIKCRGNIKDVEKELRISYPTVKNRLEDVAEALGYKQNQNTEDVSIQRIDILERVNKGEISVDEALELLKD